MPTITDDIRAKLTAEHGEIQVFETDRFGDFAFRNARKVEFSRFSSEFADVASRLHAMEVLALGTVVWPDKGELAAAFDAKPGLIMAAGNQLVDFNGLSQSEFRKK